MRAYLEKLTAKGSVHIIERVVDPVYELAAVTHRSQELDELPLLFRNVSGTALSVVSNLLGSAERVYDLLGVKRADIGPRWVHLLDHAATLTDDHFPVVPPSPELIQGSIADLPHIKWREKDGGAYISAGIFCAKDPESGVLNLSFCRTFMAGENQLICCLVPFHDLAQYEAKAHARGEELEVAILVGPPPEVFLAACASLPIDVDEMRFAAAICGEPLPMRKCASIDLLVPAETQIVIEGKFRAGERRSEGPFGEFKGYYGGVNPNGYILDVSTVTYYRDAIFQGLLCGTKDDMVPLDIAFAMRVYSNIAPGNDWIMEVCCNPMFFAVVIRIRKTSDDQPLAAAELAFAAHPKYVFLCIVVDEDVDIHDMKAVMHAFVTRGRVDDRSAIMSLETDKRDRLNGGRMFLDATAPMSMLDQVEVSRTPGQDDIDLADYFRS